MTADEIYKAILASITKVRDVRIERNTAARAAVYDTPESLTASDSLLDEMARNAAQNITLKTSVLKTGERVTVDDRHMEGVYVVIDHHRTQVCAKTVADCLDTFAAQFKTLAIELEQMARAHRGGSK